MCKESLKGDGTTHWPSEGRKAGIGHWQPNDSITGDFAYGAAKAAAIKMFDYVAFENPGLHVVNFQPGIIATGINPDITVAFDTGMFYIASCEIEAYCFSGLAWSFYCMACFEGSGVFEGEVCLGKLGRRGTHGSKG